MIVVVNGLLLRKGFLGIALWPFLVLKERGLKQNGVFMNHERIHLRQQIEMGVLPFYLWYLLEFLIRFVQYRNARLAYRNISFEREAYANEKDLRYLKRRSCWGFRGYISLFISLWFSTFQFLS